MTEKTRAQRLGKRRRDQRRFRVALIGILSFFMGAAVASPIVAMAASSSASQADADLAQAQTLIQNARGYLQAQGGTTTTTAVGATTTTTTTVPASAGPSGVPGTWVQSFGDEFNDSTLDTNKWATSGSWQCCDGGRSNSPNGELDYKTPAPSNNYALGFGALVIGERRETAPNGMAWTGGQIASKQSFTYGTIELRAQLPNPTGFGPAFWTWGAPGTNVSAQETDVFEFYTDNHGKLYLTSHATGGGSCVININFDPSTGMHTYAADIEPNGTTWYIDGVNRCTAPGHPTQAWNLIAYSPPMMSWRAPTPQSSTTHAEMTLDYVRAWHH